MGKALDIAQWYDFDKYGQPLIFDTIWMTCSGIHRFKLLTCYYIYSINHKSYSTCSILVL